MSKEIDRLQLMLKENKISHDDYRLLLTAIEKKSTPINVFLSILVNPFQKIAGLYALCSGILVILAMSYFGVIDKVYFTGIFGVLYSSILKNPSRTPTFYVLLYQNIIAVMVLASLYFLSAKLFQQKRLRIVDFIGTVALARYPYLILTLIFSLIQLINPTFIDIDLTKDKYFSPSLSMSLFMLIMLSCGVWQFLTYFFALKESSGLSGSRLWISFIGSFVIGEITASLLTNLFL